MTSPLARTLAAALPYRPVPACSKARCCRAMKPPRPGAGATPDGQSALSPCTCYVVRPLSGLSQGESPARQTRPSSRHLPAVRRLQPPPLHRRPAPGHPHTVRRGDRPVLPLQLPDLLLCSPALPGAPARLPAMPGTTTGLPCSTCSVPPGLTTAYPSHPDRLFIPRLLPLPAAAASHVTIDDLLTILSPCFYTYIRSSTTAASITCCPPLCPSPFSPSPLSPS